MSSAPRLTRIVLLALGAGALGGVALPALVAGDPVARPGNPRSATLSLSALPTPSARATAAERQALELLRKAARAGSDRAYSGTQYVSSWSTAGASSLVVDLQHVPGKGVLVRRAGAGVMTASDTTSAAALDSRPLAVLATHYSVTVATQRAACAGRPAQVIEARRRGESALAGRFWLDSATGLLLRRELYDRSGKAVRAAAFVDLQMTVPRPWTAAAHATPDATGSPVSTDDLMAFRRAGWDVPATLPGGLELFDARKHDNVLHLSYTDGLFAVSVFSQRGRLDPDSIAGWQQVKISGIRAWTRPGLSQRVIWSGGGWVRTVVADAPDSVVSAAVVAFPVPVDESFTDRIQRGLHRMGSWVDPSG